MSESLSDRFPDLHQMLASYFPGDFSLDEEVAQMVGSLQRSHLDQFESDAQALLDDESVNDDALDAYMSSTVNWDFDGGRSTLQELLARVKAAESADASGFEAGD